MDENLMAESIICPICHRTAAYENMGLEIERLIPSYVCRVCEFRVRYDAESKKAVGYIFHAQGYRIIALNLPEYRHTKFFQLPSFYHGLTLKATADMYVPVADYPHRFQIPQRLLKLISYL